MTCTRCQQPVIYQGDWPSCSCDDDPALTLTVAETASYMGVSRAMVYRLLAAGQLVANRAVHPARIPMVSIKADWAAHHRAWRLHQDIYRLGRP
ncbi:MAG TPA: helix-turn-helix domain-containing protein [Streptosporangiaceae bacterium]|nr:helix-turn-helix domain-containing protein [Streptosporangiaceae bacterium]